MEERGVLLAAMVPAALAAEEGRQVEVRERGLGTAEPEEPTVWGHPAPSRPLSIRGTPSHRTDAPPRSLLRTACHHSPWGTEDPLGACAPRCHRASSACRSAGGEGDPGPRLLGGKTASGQEKGSGPPELCVGADGPSCYCPPLWGNCSGPGTPGWFVGWWAAQEDCSIQRDPVMGLEGKQNEISQRKLSGFLFATGIPLPCAGVRVHCF